MFIGSPARLKTMSPPSSIKVIGTSHSCTTLKFLSVTLDSRFSFKEHSASIVKSPHLDNSAYSSAPIHWHNFCSWTQSRSLSFGLLRFPSLYLHPWSIPYNAYKTNLMNLFYLISPSITPWLPERLQLQWLLIHNGIIFKIVLMTFRTLFSYASCTVWNALPPRKSSTIPGALQSLEIFKRHLNTHLFRTPTWSQQRLKRL